MNITDAMTVADIIRAAQSGNRVARLRDDSDVTVGTARSIGDRDGMHGRHDDDVMSLYLRVTTDSGNEQYWAVSEIVPEVRDGLTVLDYRSRD